MTTEEEEYEALRRQIAQEQMEEQWAREQDTDEVIDLIKADDVIVLDKQEEQASWRPSRVPQPASELATKEFPDVRWLVDPILANEGVALLAAESGTNKTWLALHLAVHIALGKDWLKFKVPEPGRVLYLNCEVPEREIQRRIIRLGVGSSFPDNMDFIHDVWALDQDKDMAELLEICHKGQYKLIVADTLSKFHSGYFEENNNDHMTELMIRARQIAYHSKGLFLFNHHISKPPGYPLSLINRIRGASAIRDNAGSAILLQKQGQGKGSAVSLSNPKNWFGEEVETFKIWLQDDGDLSDFRWDEIDEVNIEDPKAAEVLERLGDYFEMRSEGFTMSDLSGGLSSSAAHEVSGILKSLQEQGRIRIEQNWRTKRIYKGDLWDED